MAGGGGTARPAGASRPTVQALRLLDVHQASLIHHNDVRARGHCATRSRHERRRAALLLDNTVFLALVTLFVPRGAMITSLSTAQPLLTAALRHTLFE